MNLSEIKTLYPDAVITGQNTNSEHYAAFPYHSKWIQFDRTQKSASELALIEHVLKNAKPTLGTTSKWRSFLFEESFEVPEADGPCRVIQFALIQKDDTFDRTLWLQEFKQLFSPIKEAFFYSEATGVLIQEKPSQPIDPDEIAGIIQTLDEDFSIKTAYYAGQFWPVNTALQHIFKEEAHIFSTQKNSPAKVLSLTGAALQHYTTESMAKSPIMQQLKARFAEQPEWKELVLAMWQSQGNISVAAKSLYVHRNTLQYRMDKLQDLTGFSLRNMDDLVLCYLLTL